MKPVAIKDDIFWIGVNDTTTRLFEGLWLIEDEGITYNSYLIKDEKNALIDLCKDSTGDLLMENIKACINPEDLDYLVINHMEPDHSGAILQLLKVNPNITLLGSKKTGAMLVDFFDIQQNFRAVQDGETLSLGKHTLRFISTPMVHWPETIMTFEEKEGILFSCDGFGGYGKVSQGIFDDEQSDLDYFIQESLRYYANIVCAFSKPVLKAAQKLAALPIKMVAPSHGLIWRKDPQKILDLYVQWSGYTDGNAPKEVCLVYASMYGNSARVLPAIQAELEAAGVKYQSFDINQTHISYILPALWSSAGIIVCAPTYEGGLFPGMEFLLEMAEKKRIYDRKAIYVGSYGWGGGAMRFINKQCEALKWDLLGETEFKGKAEPADETKIKALTRKLAQNL